jgi:uncharacterized protein
VGEVHNRLRPFKSGGGSYVRVVERVKLLRANSFRRLNLTARVTVTPANLRLRETLDELASLGFDCVLFSPMLSSPDGVNQMDSGQFEALLAQLVECSREFERKLRCNQLYPFLNVWNTLRRIHQQSRMRIRAAQEGVTLVCRRKASFCLSSFHG